MLGSRGRSTPLTRARWRCATSLPSLALKIYPETDRNYLTFADTFERRFVGQREDEERSIVETLDLAWDLLSLLPPEALTRVGAADLAKYHHWRGASAEEK